MDNGALLGEMNYQQDDTAAKFPESETQLTSNQNHQMKMLLSKYADIFSKADTDIEHTTMVTHRIDLKDETPVRQ